MEFSIYHKIIKIVALFISSLGIIPRITVCYSILSVNMSQEIYKKPNTKFQNLLTIVLRITAAFYLKPLQKQANIILPNKSYIMS